jgi:hypothetical protein
MGTKRSRRRPVSRREYAQCWGVSAQAIDKAVYCGTVLLNDDGSVDVAASDQVWGARHLARTAPIALDPETAARIDRELAELHHVTEKWLAELIR